MTRHPPHCEQSATGQHNGLTKILTSVPDLDPDVFGPLGSKSGSVIICTDPDPSGNN